MRFVFLIFFLAMGCRSGVHTENTPGFFNDTENVTVRGVLLRATYPGPPNYRSVSGGDAPETYWMLKVDKPIFAKGESMEDGSPFMTDQTQLIQLILTQDQYDKWEQMMGKKVQATGEIFIGHNGHHNTPVLLDLMRGGRLELSGDTH